MPLIDIETIQQGASTAKTVAELATIMSYIFNTII